MANKEFAQRLKTACDRNSNVPPYGRGRQTWVKECMQVSHEAVRKWFAGESRPRPEGMRRLAKVLDVDEAWLALGIAPDMQPKERRARNAQADGAVNTFMGMLQLNGWHCAIPLRHTDTQDTAVDFYGIYAGEQQAFHVSLARQIDKRSYRFSLPTGHNSCIVIGTILTANNLPVELVMPSAMITRLGEDRGGYIEVGVEKRGHRYVTGGDEWPIVSDFHQFGAEEHVRAA